MNYWFFRLGSQNHIADKNLYQALAREHSIIKIGYVIDEDITDRKSKDEIKNYIEKDIKYLKEIGAKTSAKAISWRARLIDKFINEIAVGDIIISPFGDKTTDMRIGEIKSECGTVKSFFKGKEKILGTFLKNYPGPDIQRRQDVKPARKVKWLTKEMQFSDFPKILKEELANKKNSAKIKTIRPTTTLLESLQNQDILSQIKSHFKI